MVVDPESVSARRRNAAVAGHRGDVATARRLVDDPDAGVADPDPAVRRRAAELVAQLTGDGVAAEVSIVGLLDDPEPTVVETAAWASGERTRPEPGAVARLAALATDADDALVREAAVAALGSIGDEAALPAILAATADKATVRRRAVLALAPFEGPEVDAALERARSDRDWQVRQAAEDLLG